MKMQSIYLKENVLLVFSQLLSSTKNRFATLKTISAKLSRFGRFIGMVVFASLVAKSINRPIHRKVW